MSHDKKQVPSIEGWFTMDPERPQLWGSRCTQCGSYFFPKELSFCRNPRCEGHELEPVALSTRGKIWSFTKNCFQPPPPYIAPSPFVPYIIAAVELEAERMVILGQLDQDGNAGDLRIGQEVELVLGTLYEDDENEYLVWKWRPRAG